MARHPKPWYRKSRGKWYVCIGGFQHDLGGNQHKAWNKYHELMADTGKMGEDPRVSQIVHRFLEWSRGEHTPGTHGWYKLYLDQFVGSIPKALKISELIPDHVTRWVDKTYPKADCSPSTRHGACRTVVRAINWARKQGLIDKRLSLEMPTPTRRETYVTADQYASILKVTARPFRDLIEILRHTGARPETVRLVEARHLDRNLRCWTIEKGFTKKIKRKRTVPLDDRAFELCCDWADAYPTGPMFRNRYGEPWTGRALIEQCRKARKKVGFKFTAYSFRHTFATDALKSGLDAVTVARLMGHTSTRMLDTVYSHLEDQTDYLAGAMGRATSML